MIQKATQKDIPELCTLLQYLFSQEAEFVPDRETQTRGLEKIISNPEIGIIWVARRDNKVAGMVNILFTYSTALGGPVAILEDLVVSPSARGLGIGSRLLEQALAHARHSGIKRVTLLTDESNHLAHQFYQKNRFSRSSMVPFRISLDDS
ncbi:MAG: GNAT family N-acetyltransferase [Chloroflexota bacterium]